MTGARAGRTADGANTDGANQPPPFSDINTFLLDRVLTEAVDREGGVAAPGEFEAVGARCGSAEALLVARAANRHPPQLSTLDARGERLDRIEFHPAWHELMADSTAIGLHGRLWEHLGAGGERPRGAYVARAALFYLTAGLECGHLCPMTMTSAAVAALRHQPDVLQTWLPRLTTRAYDARHRPAAAKRGVTIGMGMTERSGGSDLSGITTSAERDGDGFRLSGQKWFLSAPMSDAFLVLAKTVEGLTAFLAPRFLPDGGANGFRLVRLKDKLGNRSNASAEVELDRTFAWRIGEPGRGLATMLDMVMETRLDCAVASAGLMRTAVATAVHHARHRTIRGTPLIRQPLMAQVLADLALEVEAAVAVTFRLARAFDCAADTRAAAWRRLMTPVVKYWVTKMAPALIAEVMECLGGNGYVEDSELPRLYREAPVNAIWEGAGNVMALDVLRVLKRDADAAAIVIEDLRELAGDEAILKAGLDRLEGLLQDPLALDARARTLTEGLAQISAAVLLHAHAPQAVADAYAVTRLGTAYRQTYGLGLDWADTGALIARVLPDSD